MKKTGDDELDFVREGSEWVFNQQAKAYYKYALPFELFGLALISGAVALLSTNGALWTLVVLGSLLTLQFVVVTVVQLSGRRYIKKHTTSTEALDAVTRGFFS